jgi:hypothetical protein
MSRRGADADQKTSRAAKYPGLDPAGDRPLGQPFTVAVRVTNGAGYVIQEINSFVTRGVER